MAAIPLTLATASFTRLDLAVVIGYLVFTTVLGARLAGKPATIRDFFLGGRKLPWYAVAGSTIATEISAVTFVSVPSVVYRDGGDFTYLQLGLLGALFARLIVAYVLVPAYYRREIYSPYDYMGNRLGPAVRSTASALFALGGILAQSARVYLTALVLDMLLGPPLLHAVAARTGIDSMVFSIWIIGAIAVLWTLMGGITTVIWTDVILFGVFVIGAITALVVVIQRLDGGFGELLEAGRAAGKFRLLDFDTDPTKAYTVWTAAIATTLGNVGIYGTDQLMAQRIFCCRDERAARIAVVASSASVLVTVLVMMVGVGLFAYYRAHPLSGEWLALYQEKPDRIFPIFILDVIPSGLTGLILAGIFAAAISSLDSILAALGQTAMSAVYLPRRLRTLSRLGIDPDAPAEQRRQVRVSRILVVIAGVVLCLMAQLAIVVARRYASILDLALAMATYTSGALLAGFLLAFLDTRRDGFGFRFSAPLSVLCVFAIVWHQPDRVWYRQWPLLTGAVGGALIAIAWLVASRRRNVAARGRKTVALLATITAMLATARWGYFPGPSPTTYQTLAWPWNPCFGSLVAFALGFLLANRRDHPASDTEIACA